MKSVHNGVKYSCNQWDYQATKQGNLKTHNKSIHEGVYSCDQFYYQSDLKKHKNSVHEGVKYSCNQCDYLATIQSILKRHMNSVHEGVEFSCEQCYVLLSGYKTEHS